jgi:hypothetical protein
VHPAVGNLDGDERAEIVFGLGPGSRGWVHIRNDQVAGFGNLPGTPAAGGWLQLGWAAYQSANGTTWPAVGDLDGDGASELIVGFGTYTAAGGYLEVFNDLTDGLTHRTWARVPWAAYNGANGLARPAVSR